VLLQLSQWLHREMEKPSPLAALKMATKQGDRDARTILCEAAASMLLRTKNWTAIRA
jgi:hypothetical protein